MVLRNYPLSVNDAGKTRFGCMHDHTPVRAINAIVFWTVWQRAHTGLRMGSRNDERS